MAFHYISDTDITFPYSWNGKSYHYKANSVATILRYIICEWLNNFTHLQDDSATAVLDNILLELAANHRELYKHLLFFAIKIFFDANEKCRNKLIKCENIQISTGVSEVIEYINILEYVKYIFVNSPNLSNVSHRIHHIRMSDGIESNWMHPIKTIKRDSLKGIPTSHINCTTAQTHNYQKLQNLLQ